MAITVEYLGATNTKPSRLRVSANGVPAKFYSLDLSSAQAMAKYVKELGWVGKWVEGQLDCDKDVFVCYSKQDTITVK